MRRPLRCHDHPYLGQPTGTYLTVQFLGSRSLGVVQTSPSRYPRIPWKCSLTCTARRLQSAFCYRRIGVKDSQHGGGEAEAILRSENQPTHNKVEMATITRRLASGEQRAEDQTDAINGGCNRMAGDEARIVWRHSGGGRCDRKPEAKATRIAGVSRRYVERLYQQAKSRPQNRAVEQATIGCPRKG